MNFAINVTTPDGQCGPWAIQSFEIGENESAIFNLSVSLKGYGPDHFVVPGKYKRLVHKDRGVVMSNTPMEVRTNLEFILRSKGNVLINGLGLGMVLHAILAKEEVQHVTVVELDLDVIALTAPHFRDAITSGRLKIEHSDCFTYQPPKEAHYDVVWHDIWDTISDENLAEMGKLRRKYSRKADLQLCWAEKDCKSMKAEFIKVLHENGKTYAAFKNYLQTGVR